MIRYTLFLMVICLVYGCTKKSNSLTELGQCAFEIPHGSKYKEFESGKSFMAQWRVGRDYDTVVVTTLATFGKAPNWKKEFLTWYVSGAEGDGLNLQFIEQLDLDSSTGTVFVYSNHLEGDNMADSTIFLFFENSYIIEVMCAHNDRLEYLTKTMEFVKSVHCE